MTRGVWLVIAVLLSWPLAGPPGAARRTPRGAAPVSTRADRSCQMLGAGTAVPATPLATAGGTAGVELAAMDPPDTTRPAVQEILHSRYRLLGKTGPLGYTDFTEFRRPDGSRSYLARERMEFWGPVLDRFVVLTYDARGQFDSGHWVGTSAYSPAFTYTFRFDGRAIRGDWHDDVRGDGWTEVPSRPENPVVGFWGPLEARVLARFDPAGPDTQRFEAVDVEDSHHRLLNVTVERIGTEHVEVPAGRFRVTHYRSERFGPTDHWMDERGILIRWTSEGGTYRWDLERYPSATPLERAVTIVASGIYEVWSAGRLSGTVPWRIEKTRDGDLQIVAEEQLDRRRTHFEGFLDNAWRWKGSSETAWWLSGEGDGPAEIHHLETFFYRDRVHLLRFRDRAYPLLQSRAARAPVWFHLVDYPITATFWLSRLARVAGKNQSLRSLAHIANRYRGGGLEIQDASVSYLGRASIAGPSGRVSGRHLMLRYPGGWQDSTFEFWTDARFIPLRVKVDAGEGALEYRLKEYRVTAPEAIPGGRK